MMGTSVAIRQPTRHLTGHLLHVSAAPSVRTPSGIKQPPRTHAPCRCRGDIINAPDFAESARIPDPARLVKAYNQSAATLNLLRGFSTGRLTWLAAATLCCSSRSWHLCMQLQLAPETSVGVGPLQDSRVSCMPLHPGVPFNVPHRLCLTG